MDVTTIKTSKYPLMIDIVAKKLLKNKGIGRKYVSKILGCILHIDYQILYNELKVISEDIASTTNTINSQADVMLENKSILA